MAIAENEPAAPRQRSVVETQLALLSQRAETLKNHVNELEKRLAPMLGAAPPLSETDGAKVAQEPCEFAARLAAVTDTLDATQYVVETTLERLQL